MLAVLLPASTLPPSGTRPPTEDLPGPWSSFEPFTLAHAVTVLVCVGVMLGLCAWGRRLGHTTPAELRLRWAMAIAGFAWQCVSVSWFLRPVTFTWGNSLPLQICDLIGLLAPIALISPYRLPRTLVYFFGIGLSTQAFVTPVVRDGPVYFGFWIFWINHIIIVGFGLYEVLVKRYRPALRDLLMAVIAGMVYVVCMLILNHLMRAQGANYGFIGNVDMGKPTLADSLGPWPWRVVWMGVLANTTFVVLWAIWPIGRLLLGRPMKPATDGQREPVSQTP